MMLSSRVFGMSRLKIFYALLLCVVGTGCSSQFVAPPLTDGVTAQDVDEYAALCLRDLELADRDEAEQQAFEARKTSRRDVLKRLSEVVANTAARDTAVRVLNDYCIDGNRSSSELFKQIFEVAENLRTTADSIPIDWQVSGGEKPLSMLLREVADQADSARTGLSNQLIVIDFQVSEPGADLNDSLNAGDTISTPLDPDQCDRALSESNIDVDCTGYMREVAVIYNAVQGLFATATAVPVNDELVALDGEWTEFMGATKDQTPLELAWNGYLFRKSNKGYRSFVDPPEWQQILLKPYIAVDWDGEAPDGSEVKEAVVLDVWGIKRWRNNSRWYMPIGASVHLAGSDRAEADDLGIGLSVHFNEYNTIGFTSYGGEIAVFFSFDLWRTATDEVTNVRDRVDDFREDRSELDEIWNEIRGE